MAFTSIIFENPNTNVIKEAPVGFSWTVFFFGFFPALFRADWKWAVIIFIIGIMTFFISDLIFMFIYNKLYIQDLINLGFRAKSIGTGNMEFAEGKLKIQIPRLKKNKIAYPE